MDNDEDVLGQLDARIDAIKSHRNWREKKRDEAVEALDEAWDRVLEAARVLRGRLRGNPRVRYFTIARDQTAVTVSFHQSGGGSDLLSLHRFHPEGRFPMTHCIWSRRPGLADGRHTDGREAVDLLVRHCAAHLSD